MNKSFSKNLLRKILTQIKIGISKRVSFIKIGITPNTSIKNFLYICHTLKKIGLISHVQKKSLENNYFILWLNFTVIGTNAHLVSYNKFGRITSIPYQNFKQIKKTNLANLDSIIISTNKGILTEQQLLKLQIGGIYLYSVRYINAKDSFVKNLQINIQSVINEQLFKNLYKTI
jgi:ribosomal protein S8